MSTIPVGTKFHGVASSVDTVDRGSALIDTLREAYTIDDIASYTYTGTTATLEPEFMTVTPGGASTITTTKKYRRPYMGWRFRNSHINLTFSSRDTLSFFKNSKRFYSSSIRQS